MKKFKTESQKLLDLMINSIYTNKEIFLRELISNASDAIDKLHFRSLTDNSISIDSSTLAIHLNFDKVARTITVSDNGIGMTQDQLDRNLGTIAHSDSQEFKTENSDQQGGDVDIIGQFGVGFYSSFMVAEKVEVVSRAFGEDEAWVWESDGIKGYTIKPSQRDTHGTDVILHLKQDTAEEDYDVYLTDYKLKELVKKYSNYVRYPIIMEVTHSRQKPKPEDAGEDYVPEWENYTEVETVNSMIPIWKRSKSEVSDEDYAQFYKSEFHDVNDPLRTISFHAEGSLNYDVLLFIPSKSPDNLFTREYKKGPQLFSSNVMIQEHCEELLPDYFNFVRGIVDSQDLTLNISRETLQQNSQLKAMARRIEKKIKAELENLLKTDREAFEGFWGEFGDVLKFGIYHSYGSARDVIEDFLMFHSAKEDRLVTLREYVDAMPEDQEAIYFASGDDLERVAKMPAVAGVMNRGYDVLLGSESLDDFCLTVLGTYAEKDIKNASAADTDVSTEEEKKEAETVAEDNKELLETMKEALGDKVERVAISTRLTSAKDMAACITADGPMSFGMESVMKSMPGAPAFNLKRVLEINAKHPVFEALKSASDLGQKEKVGEYAVLLLNQSLMVEGLPVDDPIAFAAAVSKLMV